MLLYFVVFLAKMDMRFLFWCCRWFLCAVHIPETERKSITLDKPIFLIFSNRAYGSCQNFFCTSAADGGRRWGPTLGRRRPPTSRRCSHIRRPPMSMPTSARRRHPTIVPDVGCRRVGPMLAPNIIHRTTVSDLQPILYDQCTTSACVWGKDKKVMKHQIWPDMTWHEIFNPKHCVTQNSTAL